MIPRIGRRTQSPPPDESLASDESPPQAGSRAQWQTSSPNRKGTKMPDEKVIPTPDEIRATFAPVRETIATMNLCLDATIDDYPIGRRERGKCRLQVERAAGKGYRTVRTTTNKVGRWCAPKKSTYHNSVTVVVRDYDEDHQVVWLSAGNPAAQFGGAHVGLQYANGSGIALAKCWRNDAPRREDHHYTTVTRTSRLGITGAGVETDEPTQEKETTTLEADSPKECDAWDVWVQELKSVRELLRNVWAAAETVSV